MDLRTIFFSLIAIYWFCSCSIYRSEGRKTFETNAPDYKVKNSSCEWLDSQKAAEILRKNQNAHYIIQYSEKDELYYSCPKTIESSPLEV